jgi:hypothetical protein
MSSPTPLLFQLTQANRQPENRFDYNIKHYFLQALSLHQAHVYVTLYGYRITPDFYEDGDEVEEVVHPPYVIEQMEQQKLEEYEQSNESCSCGEHYWHSIKEIDTKKYDGRVIEVNDGSQLFKLSIQFKYPCIHLQNEADEYKYNMYRSEQNTCIYQLKGANKDDILQYLFQHLEQFNLTAEILLTQLNKSSLDDMKTWNEFSLLCEESIKCTDNSEGVHHEKIIFSLHTMTEPITMHNSEM